MSAHNQKPLNIFLAELGHTYFNISPATIPIGVAYISAKLKKEFGDDVKIKIFRYPDKLRNALKDEKPDVAGFGFYNWNENLGVYFARLIRRKYPETILVAGGLNIPPDGEILKERYLDKYGSLFDAYIPYEGEQPMVNLAEALLDSCSRKTLFTKQVPGCFLTGEEGVTGKKIEPYIIDLKDIPSPYLSGILDNMLADPMLSPIIQTMRGCPYSCAYCVGGKSEYSKIRPFPIEQVKDEILYLKNKAKNRSLRMTDDNFGILPRDVELAEFIKKMSVEDGYPQSLNVYTGKIDNENVKKVMLALKDFIPFNISLQSTTPNVLSIIKRNNISLAKIGEAFQWAKNNNMITATEILHGFPEETYQSYMECIQDLFKIRVDSASSHEVWLLPNTELADEKNRIKYGLQSRFTLGADAISVFDDEIICEYDEHVVGSKSMSLNEHYKLCEVDLFIAFALYIGYFRELTYHAFTYDIKPVDIFNEIRNISGEYPVLSRVFSEYGKKVKNSHFLAKEDVHKHVGEIIKSKIAFPPTRILPITVGEFIFSAELGDGIDEYIKAMLKLYKGKDEDKNLFYSVCKELKNLAIAMVINPEKSQEDIFINANYDFPRWISGYYSKKASEYESRPFKLKLSVPNLSQVKDIYEKGRALNSASERIQLFYRHVNSSCLRRKIDYAA